MKDDWQGLRDKLNECYEWPALYSFKFVAPLHQVEKVKEIFPGKEMKTRASAQGNYLSLTIQAEMKSAEEIIAIYQHTAAISGVISL